MSYSAGQKMANRRYNERHRHEKYIDAVRPAIVHLDATAGVDAINEALASVDEFASAGKLTRRNMREAARAILGIDQPVPTPAIVRSANGTYLYELAGRLGCALTPDECRRHGRKPGPANI